METEFNTRYLFRGIRYSKGPVKQSTIWFSRNGVGTYSRGNLVLGNEPMQGRFNEVDFGGWYERKWARLTWSAGVDCYRYRAASSSGTASLPGTCETFFKLSYSAGAVSLFAEQFADTGSYRGAYFGEVGLSRERPLKRGAVVEISSRLAWANATYHRSYSGVPVRGLDVVGFTMSVTRAMGRHVYVRPRAEVAGTIDKRLPGSGRSRVAASVGVALGYRWAKRY